MKKVALFVGLICGVAMGAVGSQVAQLEVQAASRAAPTVTSGDFYTAGLSLNDMNYFRVMVCTTDSADALQATGTLGAYLLDERSSTVSRNKLLDLDVSTQAAARCIQFPDQTVGVPYGRLIYAATSLKLTDGGTLLTQSDGGLDAGAFTVYYRGWKVAR